jgi:hypothetical protein
MFKYNALEERFGKYGVKRLEGVKFVPVPVENQSGITHTAMIRIPLLRAIPDSMNRKAAVDWYLDFLIEVISMIHDQAAQLFQDIIIQPDLNDSIVATAKQMLDKVLSGHALYVPHLDNTGIPIEVADELSLGDKYIGHDLTFFIRRQTTIRLFWFISTKPVTVNPNNRSIYVNGPILERVSDTDLAT